mmetsp:Transcript_18328/g.51927  ORF Transcript_18328/g.51927 Transcript_18328/m.51927 type:complete len:835 (+) Transcript_18328:25-2529(+)
MSTDGAMEPPPCCRGTRAQRRRDAVGVAPSVPCRSVCAVGFSVAVASSLPAASHAALSISSGYEQFLTHIRRRIVLEKEDIFDEAEHRGWAKPCDSMRDGPFCRGLPKLSPATSRHRPFTVDSIIPQHLFGDPRLSKELGKMHETSSVGTEFNKQAMNTLNQFLEDFYNPKETLPRVTAVEGRLELQHAPLWRTANLEPTFSRGLPPGVVAGWGGAWQVLPGPVEGRQRAGGGRKEEASDLPRFVASARLNGAIGTLSFSRPVIVRYLVVRPPLHATEGRHQLLVRARKKGVEAWRAEYDYDAAVGPTQPPLCAVGDVVRGQRVANGPRALAVLLAVHTTSATVRWLEKADHTHRLLSWKHITTTDGMPCSSTKAPFLASEDRGHNRSPGLWRDLARRMKSVDEISFLVPFGTEGWLIKDVVAATVKWSPPTVNEASEDVDDDDSASPTDPMAHMVQVLPGPQALIVEASRAAVMYHADDMLEQGLQVRSSRPASPTGAGVDDVLSAGADDEAESSSQIHLNPARSVEGLQQLLRALGDDGGGPSARLPPHVGPDLFLRDMERLVGSLDLSKAGRLVKQFGHFEALVAYHWDWFTALDAVDVTFEHWRRSGKAQAEAADAFFEGQEWLGSYFCTQGPTALSLNVTQVSSRRGRDHVTADLTFMIENEDSHVRGVYEVSGQVDPAGRTAVLEPIPGSWKTKPQNFVMVGLQGVVSRAAGAGGELRFAGSVPIFGCDSFELRARGQKKGAPDGAEHIDQQTSLWNSALSRYIHALNEARQQWRVGLRQVIREKEAGTKNITSQVAKLVQAAKDAGVLSFDLKTSETGELVVELGGQ